MILDRWVIYCIWKEEKHLFLMNTTTRTRALGRPRSRWYDNIKSTLQKQGVRACSRFNLPQNRDNWKNVLNRTMYFMVP